MAESRRNTMNYTVSPGFRSGSVSIPSSKSYAHRQLICAALSGSRTCLKCDGVSKDIEATAACLQALGADIRFEDGRIIVEQGSYLRKRADLRHSCENEKPADRPVLPCGESGSTLRFLLPLVGALGIEATFEMAPGLAARPVEELLEVMGRHGVNVTRGECCISIEGRMTSGEFEIPGNVSSQYISGLLLALPVLEGDSRLVITGHTESKEYIKITEDNLRNAGIVFKQKDNTYFIPGGQTYRAPARQQVEKDWSGAAFFLCMGALSPEGITLPDMPLESSQGDRRILEVLEKAGAHIEINSGSVTARRGALRATDIDASEIPDLVPTIAAFASLCEGRTVIRNAGRLKIKESDRLATTAGMLRALGAEVSELEDGLVIVGKRQLEGGTVDACNDHRIAMSAAVAACGCQGEVTVTGAECVAKSYPAFWEHLKGLEIKNEQ